MNKEIRLEDLVGTRLLGADGQVVGRISEVQAEWRGHHCVVTELHLGKGLSVRIGNVDLSDPKRPRLLL